MRSFGRKDTNCTLVKKILLKCYYHMQIVFKEKDQININYHRTYAKGK